MFILQIEHPVRDYDAWKEAFDSDPLGREKSGVRRYRVFRAADNPNHVMIDLEFDGLSDAEAFRSRLLEMWRGGAGQMLENPRARIVDVVESKEF